MSKRRMLLHALSMFTLITPNTVYLFCNFDVLKEANAVSLTMVAILTLSIVGVGAITHVKVKGGIWAILIGLFILSLSNIAYVAGMALLIEGGGIAIDGYIFKPLIEKTKIREFEKNGRSITYTKEFK